MKLTKGFIDDLAYTGKTQVHWDDRIPGFGIRVLPSGSKVFVFKYRHAGRSRFSTLGKFGAITLHQALKLAQDRYMTLKTGLDPKTESDRQRLQNKTVADLADYFYENHTKIKNRDHGKVKSRIKTWVKPKIGKLLVRDVKRPDIARLHTEIGKEKPVSANRVLSLLSKMFNEAQNWGYLEEGASNPAQGIKRFTEVSRDRFVSREEMPRLAKAINSRDLFTRSLIWLYLLTGLRRQELLGLKWDDVDFAEARLKIGLTKRGNAHHLPLSPPSIKILASLPHLYGNPHVFPGVREGDHRRDFRRQWDLIKKEAEIEDLRIHDLRRTVGSYLAQQGQSLALIGSVLNHANPKTTQIYARFSDQPVRKALEDHGRILEGVIEGD